MLFKKIITYPKNLMDRASSYIEIGKDILDYGREVIKERLEAQPSGKHSKNPSEKIPKELVIEKNFIIPKADNSFIKGKQESLRASQGITDHSGCSYHGPGKPGENVNSNMAQRNFENHQGN
jgi:hypothetical protein